MTRGHPELRSERAQWEQCPWRPRKRTALCWLGNQAIWTSGSSWGDTGAPGLDVFGGHRCPSLDMYEGHRCPSLDTLTKCVFIFSLASWERYYCIHCCNCVRGVFSTNSGRMSYPFPRPRMVCSMCRVRNAMHETAAVDVSARCQPEL